MRKSTNSDAAGGNALAHILHQECSSLDFGKNCIVTFNKNEIIYDSEHEIDALYFPINLIVSMTCDLSSGYSAEFTQIGCDGVVGVSALMDGHGTGNTAIAQTSGRAYRVPADVVRKTFDRSSAFRRAILHYMQALMQESAQRIACIQHHSVLQQFCRTLLMAADRLNSENVNLTHEQLAVTIGCRREAVSVAAGKIQAAGLIDYSYGRITILDRPGIEARACECYGVIHKAFGEFLPHRTAASATTRT